MNHRAVPLLAAAVLLAVTACGSGQTAAPVTTTVTSSVATTETMLSTETATETTTEIATETATESVTDTQTVTQKAAPPKTIVKTSVANSTETHVKTVTETAAPAGAGSGAGGAASFPDGDYIVGSDVAPGNYKASGGNSDCFWSTFDRANNPTDNGFSTITAIHDSDFSFSSHDCGTWQRVG